MPAGASPKREREYRTLKREFEREGRYPGREEEVAARIVNRQRAERGETKAAATTPRRSGSTVGTPAARATPPTRPSSTRARRRASPG
jgi:hypothetical protein